MNNLLQTISHHGYLFLFLIVFAEASGLPAPAALALIAAGAAAASHLISTPLALVIAMVAMLLGDILLFILGRYTGWALLAFLCRVSMNPETCILRSAESFYKRGKLTLIFAKFIPGVNTMAPPLAGSMKMKLTQFLRLDTAGTCLYVLAYGALGFLPAISLRSLRADCRTPATSLRKSFSWPLSRSSSTEQSSITATSRRT